EQAQPNGPGHRRVRQERRPVRRQLVRPGNHPRHHGQPLRRREETMIAYCYSTRGPGKKGLSLFLKGTVPFFPAALAKKSPGTASAANPGASAALLALVPIGPGRGTRRVPS